MNKEEQPEQILCLLNNTTLQKIVAVWKGLQFPRNGELGPDIEEIEAKTGIEIAKIKYALPILYGNNVVDKSGPKVNKYAETYLRKLVLNSIK